MVEKKGIETMIATTEEPEAAVILSFMQGLDRHTLNNFHEFIEGVRYGMNLAKKEITSDDESLGQLKGSEK